MTTYFKCSLFSFLIFITSTSFASHFLIGGNLGMNYQVIKTSETNNWSNSVGMTKRSLANDAFNGDILIGYAHTYQKLLLGLTVGVTFLNNHAQDKTYGAFQGNYYNEGDKITLNNFYELLIHAGYALKEGTVLYIAPGVAFGGFKFLQYSKLTTTNEIRINNSKSLSGFDIGIGLKEALTPQLALNLFIQNINFQSYTTLDIHGQDNIRFTPNVFLGKIGLEYRFG